MSNPVRLFKQTPDGLVPTPWDRDGEPLHRDSSFEYERNGARYWHGKRWPEGANEAESAFLRDEELWQSMLRTDDVVYDLANDIENLRSSALGAPTVAAAALFGGIVGGVVAFAISRKK